MLPAEALTTLGAFGLRMPAVPLAVAVLAGALTTLNPCSFPLLPAFLSYYVGASERDLPRARTSVLQGALVGLTLAAGCVALIGGVLVPLTTARRPWRTPSRSADWSSVWEWRSSG